MISVNIPHSAANTGLKWLLHESNCGRPRGFFFLLLFPDR